MSKHTALPWIAGYNGDEVCIGTKDFEFVAMTMTCSEDVGDQEDYDNATFIVHCVNTHQTLVDALEAMLPIVKQYITEAGGCDHSVGICMCGEIAVAEQAQEALKQAKEREA